MIPSLPSILSRLRFRHLSLLMALDEHGSLHKAAEKVGMTQPGLTRALREIESTFGAELFSRSAKGVLPTELGHCVIRYARLIASDLGHLRDEAERVQRGTGGRLAVGAIAGALHGVLIAALQELRRRQPALSIEVQEATSLALLDQLSEGRLDVAICRTTVAAHAESYHYEALLDENVVVAAHPLHPLLKARRVSWAQLASSSWIFYPSNLPLRALLEREFSEAGLALPRYSLETASTFATMLLLQEHTQSAALMTDATMRFCESHGIAGRLPIKIQARHEGYGIVTRAGAPLSPAAQLLIECLRLVARQDQSAA